MKLQLPSAFLLSLLLLTACNKQDADKSGKQAESDSVSGIMAKATAEARQDQYWKREFLVILQARPKAKSLPKATC